ncbi:MAG: hypothetical protein QX194_04875 [Methylococcales bacterium]
MSYIKELQKRMVAAGQSVPAPAPQQNDKAKNLAALLPPAPKQAAISVSTFDLMPNFKLPTVENQPLEPIADFDNVLNELESIKQKINEPAPPVQHDVKPKEKTCLLKIPKKRDAWCEVINEMTNEIYAEAEYSELPKGARAKVWASLCANPPHGYAITTGEDRGEVCLNMEGCKSLGKKAFQERWRNYTK